MYFMNVFTQIFSCSKCLQNYGFSKNEIVEVQEQQTPATSGLPMFPMDKSSLGKIVSGVLFFYVYAMDFISMLIGFM